MICKIISGGQTGVDRAALDAALKHGIDCGGWCPTGRLDEFGRIPQRYPVQELQHGGFDERTIQNVKDSDGTLIIYCRRLHGGTQFTVEWCGQLRRPHRPIDASTTLPEDAAQFLSDFVQTRNIKVLNVAGPRESEWPEGYDYAFRALNVFLRSSTRLRATSAQQGSKTKSKRRSQRTGITRSAAPLPDRGGRRSKRGSKQRASKSKTR
jgi:Circularly permutated YpsA SLOG family